MFGNINFILLFFFSLSGASKLVDVISFARRAGGAPDVAVTGWRWFLINSAPSSGAPRKACYLHVSPPPFHGWGSKGHESDGSLEATRGIFALHTTRESGRVFTPPLAPDSPFSLCLPASIINCVAAAGVREENGKRERERE